MKAIGHITNSFATQNNEFTEGDILHGIPPTILQTDWLNTVQRELIALAELGGEACNPDNDQQISQIISKLTPLNQTIVPSKQSHEGPSIYPTVLTKDHCLQLTLTETDNQLTINADQAFIWRGVWRIMTNDYDETGRTFSLSANTNYHLRWQPEGFFLKNVHDSNYNPSQLDETHSSFDTQIDDMLIAKIVMDNTVAKISLLANAPSFNKRWDISHRCSSASKQHEMFWNNPALSTLVLNWARTPHAKFCGLSDSKGYGSYGVSNIWSMGIKVTRYEASFFDAMAQGSPPVWLYFELIR